MNDGQARRSTVAAPTINITSKRTRGTQGHGVAGRVAFVEVSERFGMCMGGKGYRMTRRPLGSELLAESIPRARANPAKSRDA